MSGVHKSLERLNLALYTAHTMLASTDVEIPQMRGLMRKARDARREVNESLNLAIEFKQGGDRNNPLLNALIDELMMLSVNLGRLIRLTESEN